MPEIKKEYQDIEGIITESSLEVGKKPVFKVEQTPFVGFIAIKDAVVIQRSSERDCYHLWLENLNKMLTVPNELFERDQPILVRHSIGRKPSPYIPIEPIMEQIDNLQRDIGRSAIIL